PTSPSSSGRQTLAPTTIASCSSRRLSSRTLTCAPALGVCNEHRPAGHADHRQGAEILPARSPWLGRRTGADVPAGARAVGSRCRESSTDGGEAMSTDTIDTKALIAATPATVALVRRELDKSREAQRGGCGIPKAVKVDCAMVERLCRIAEKQADRLAALEAEIASLRTDRDGAAEACRMLQEDKARLEQDNARLAELEQQLAT